MMQQNHSTSNDRPHTHTQRQTGTLQKAQEPLQSMLSGLGFQQGLLQAAAAVAAQALLSYFLGSLEQPRAGNKVFTTGEQELQVSCVKKSNEQPEDVMKPFAVLKMCGSRGALVSPRSAIKHCAVFQQHVGEISYKFFCLHPETNHLQIFGYQTLGLGSILLCNRSAAVDAWNLNGGHFQTESI